MKTDESAVAFKEFIDSLPSGNKAKGSAFEEFCVEHIPNQKGLGIEQAWLWKDWKHRWGADLGIDFVVRDSSGGFWAGQSKALGDGAQVSKREVDSFLNESAGVIPDLGVHFTRRLIVTTGDGLGRNAKSALSRRTEIPTLVLSRKSLETWTLSPASHKAEVAKKTPKKHQELAISKVKKHFEGNQKGQLIMACGTGKTLTALWIYEALESELCVVAVPSLSLMKQTLNVWSAEARRKFMAISICSDETVAPSLDQLVSSVIELEVPVTTKPSELTQHMRIEMPKVIFTTYASFPKLIELLTAVGVRPDLTIADEAHRTVGQKGRLTSLIHDSAKYVSDRTLFMSATPRIVAGDKRDSDGEFEVLSMDSEEHFGSEIHNLTFYEAIHEEKLLVDYEIHNLIIKDDELFNNLAIDSKLKGHAKDEQQSLFDAVIPQVTFAFLKKLGLGNTISYHSRKARAESFKAALNSMGDPELEAHFVSGDMSSRAREEVLDKFKLRASEYTIVSNARCLTEGIDVPNLDAVAFVDPRYSVTDIVQAVGRVLRTSPGKKKGHILVPMIVSSSGEYSRESYMGIMRVIKAMESHDPSLIDEINAVSRALGAGEEPSRLSKLKLENLSELPDDFMAKISSNLLIETLDAFSAGLGNLISFIKIHDRQPVRGEEWMGRVPERWRSKQRSNYNAGLLSERRIGEIETAFEDAFGPDYWAWDQQLAHDLEMAGHLEEFVKSKLNGGTYYPYVRVHRKAGKSVCEHGVDVGKWSFSLNIRARKTGLDGLLKDRIDRIQNYTTKDSNVETFLWALDQYLAYRNDHDGFPPDGDFRTGTFGTTATVGYPLGDTVANWRASRKKKSGQGAMPEWKVKALDEVGFEWTVPRGNFRKTRRKDGADLDERVRELSEVMGKIRRRPRRGEFRFTSKPEADMYIWINRAVAGKLALTDEHVKKLHNLGIKAQARNSLGDT